MTAAIAGIAVAGAAGAAAPTSPLSSNDPARLKTDSPPPAASPALALPDVPAAPPPKDDTVRLVLHGVVFDNAVAVPASKLQSAWAAFREQPVTLSDLRTIGRNAERLYADAGYPFVAVQLRVQEVQNGVVHYEVVEGKITDLTVLGSDPAARRQATAALSPLVNKTPLSVDDVQMTYELARSVPGLNVSGTLRRGSQPGGLDLVVAARREAWRSYVNVNNLYADPVGPWGALLGVDYLGDSDFGDETSVQVYTSVPLGRQILLRGSHARRLNAQGTTVTLSGLWGDANPKGSLAPLELATREATVRLELSQPIWMRPGGSVIVAAAVEARNQKTRIFSNVGLSNDHLRTMGVSLAAEHTGALGRIAVLAEARKGLDFLGASQVGDADLSRVGADPQAAVYRLNAEGESAAMGRVRLAARVSGQYASRPLTAPDQFTAGNLTIGRGYQPGAALGDSALGFAGEVRVGPFPVAHVLAVEPFGFYDTLRLWNHGVAPFATHSLQSVGGGLRFQVPGKVHIDLTYAVPLKPPLGLGERRPSPTLLLNVTMGLNDAFNAIHRRMEKGVAK